MLWRPSQKVERLLPDSLSPERLDGQSRLCGFAETDMLEITIMWEEPDIPGIHPSQPQQLFPAVPPPLPIFLVLV